MITIAIVSDIVCPWCFIGKRRLATAIALVQQDHPDFQYQIRWLPFFLNPDTPPEGVRRRDIWHRFQRYLARQQREN